jgi:hypothetical protein
MGPELPLFIMGCIILFYLLSKKPFHWVFSKMGIHKEDPPIDLDENLGTYFQCINPWDSKLWYTK